MSNFLKPHSKEWFEELEKQNPSQAAQTRQLISMAGSEEVCSVCGDDEANDYKLEGAQATPGTAITLRLCDDCLGIRKTMHGEDFVPFVH